LALEASDPAWIGALERVRAIATGSILAMASPDVADDRDRLHAKCRRAMQLARGRIEDCRSPRRSSISAIAARVDRVRHDLIFLDRLSGRQARQAREAGACRPPAKVGEATRTH